MQNQAFLRSIIENWEDDTPRLVYADWLEEHGNADRAEFIRVQCELARMTNPPTSWNEQVRRLCPITPACIQSFEELAHREALEERERDLLRTYR
jgi:uncharacterized protein (TIGR02996 family)